jgi:hypothetical protein
VLIQSVTSEAEQSVTAGTHRDVFEYMLRNQSEQAAAEPEPAVTGRGHVDFYGYHTAAHGWFFCGWLAPEHPALDGRVNVIAYFEC